MYCLMQPSDRAEILALWQREHGEDETFLANAIERFAGEQNVYVAEENDHIEAVAMAVELAPFQVRVNALNPVAGDTPLLKTFMGEDTPEVRAKFLASIPIGRFSTPEDMGAAAAFLCSDDASMITGVALEVDGGRCI